MVNQKLSHFIILLIALLSLSVVGLAQEKRKISRKQVPAPVEESFKKTFPGASIKNAEVEEKEGRLIYYLEGKRNGQEVEAVYAVAISLIETQEDITISELSAAVTAAIKAAHPAAEITEAEKIMKDGSLLGYEVELKDGEKTLELRLDPTGKILERNVD